MTRGQNSTKSSQPATEQPGNSFKYLYWRLSQNEFQQLCGALLTNKFNEVRCFPVGMADGGIDAISHGDVIYQVKWTSKVEQNPHTWLKNAVKGELPKIRQLIEQGNISKYILMTSVAATTTAQRTGSMQKLEDYQAEFERDLGIPLEVWWQADIDAEIDIAPDAIKWAYQEMLAGSDAIRYLINADRVEGRAARMRDTLLKVMATQSIDDEKIKFSQLDMDRVSVSKLFVDVYATLQSPPRNARDEFQSKYAAEAYKSQGALKTLLKTPVPMTYLLGVPGQGKSTLGQYLAQIHRAALLPGYEESHYKSFDSDVFDAKLPLRIDLKDYASWLVGHDPYGTGEADEERRPRRKAYRSLELFIADFCSAMSGGREVNVEEIHSLLERFPTLLILDGLDEIADPKWRGIVVGEINAAAARMSRTSTLRNFQILVTARPNASNLAEPDKDVFQTLRLEPMQSELQQAYVTKWCDVNSLRGKERRDLQRTFAERTSLDHVAQLADNPMQLTILLYLINKRGDAVPVSRTPLYTAYMETLLDREVNRQQISRHQIPQVEEVTAFLGWHMHSGVESAPEAGRMGHDEIVNTLHWYFRDTEGPYDQVDSLFTAASDRFWALTSKVEGSFEFVVQPVREYFAARFLAQWAGRDCREPLSKEVIIQKLIDRPYWLNTARFYAGFASPNELASLRYGIDEALATAQLPLQARVASWALLSDGIFANNLRVQRDVVKLLVDDLSLVLITDQNGTGADFPQLSQSAGGLEVAEQLLGNLKTSPFDSLAPARIRLLLNHAGVATRRLRDWWNLSSDAAIGNEGQNTWLKIRAQLPLPRLDETTVSRLKLEEPADYRAALSVGASPENGSKAAQRLLRSVLDGFCSDIETSSTAEAGLLLRAFRPQWFHQLAQTQREGPEISTGHFWISERDRSVRSRALTRLAALGPGYTELKRAANARGKGQKGTTEPWQNPARELTKIYGPSLLASEIAVAGAASLDTRPEGSLDSEGEPFGPEMDYGTFVMEVHKKPPIEWWERMYDEYTDELSRMTWTLALLATSSTRTIVELLDRVETHLMSLPADVFHAVASASSRLGVFQRSRRIGNDVLEHLADRGARTKLLVFHFLAAFHELDMLEGISDEDLNEALTESAADWPVVRALAGRIASRPNEPVLEGLSRIHPDFPLDLPNDYVLDPDYANKILEHPSSFPNSLTVAAERTFSAKSNLSTFEVEMRQSEWVPKIPRI